MSRFHSYLSSTVKIIGSYKKGEPLNHHLKQFFASNKKYGSRDRKQIASLCYHYFRCAHLFSSSIDIERIILNSIFLCNQSQHEILNQLAPELNEKIELPLEDKFSYLEINLNNVFKFKEQLSDQLDQRLFAESIFNQSALFLRVRPGNMNKVVEKLNQNQIHFQQIGEDVIKCNNSVKINEILKVNKEVVIQDLNSQRVFNYLRENDFHKDSRQLQVWDTCAASGGKSILIYDILKGKIKLTASDIRENILLNYTSRLQEAGVNIYRKFKQDLSVASGLNNSDKFDLVVCDVPCSGSGTWARTPEQYFSFEKENILDFVEKQKSIVKHVLPHLHQNGLLFYITCSVFKSENDDMVKFIITEYNLNLLEQKYLKGYNDNADTMFIAVFKL